MRNQPVIQLIVEKGYTIDALLMDDSLDGQAFKCTRSRDGLRCTIKQLNAKTMRNQEDHWIARYYERYT